VLRVGEMSRAELEAMAAAGTLRAKGRAAMPGTFRMSTDAEGYLCCTLRPRALISIIR
jgi:hypothetical protein